VVYARRMVGSFCSIKDKNCFQPIDFEKKLLLVRRKKSRAYLLGNRLFLIAISRSSRVTWPSPSLSNSSKNRFPSISAYLKKSCTEKSFFLSGCPSADVDDLLTSCGTNSMSSISETAESVERSRSTFDNGTLSSRAGNFCTDCGVAVALALSTSSLSSIPPPPPPPSWSLTGAGAEDAPMIAAGGGGAPTFAKPRLERNPSKSALFPSITFLRI